MKAIRGIRKTAGGRGLKKISGQNPVRGGENKKSSTKKGVNSNRKVEWGEYETSEVTKSSTKIRGKKKGETKNVLKRSRGEKIHGGGHAKGGDSTLWAEGGNKKTDNRNQALRDEGVSVV